MIIFKESHRIVCACMCAIATVGIPIDDILQLYCCMMECMYANLFINISMDFVGAIKTNFQD